MWPTALTWTVHGSNFLEETYIWLNAQYPYWSRKGGRDHIIVSDGGWEGRGPASLLKRSMELARA